MWDSRDAELVQQMRDLGDPQAAVSKGILLSICRGLGSQLLFPGSPVDCCSEGDDQSTCRFIVILVYSTDRIDTTFKSTVSFKCNFRMQLTVFHVIEVPIHAVESYDILSARVIIVPAENSDGICNIGPSGSHRLHTASDHPLVNG